MEENEVWKDVVGWEGYYQVSNLGKVKSLTRRVEVCHPICGTSFYTFPGRVLKLHKGQNGYLAVMFCLNAKTKNYSVHRIVAEAFIENPYKKPEVNHVNRIKTDNSVKNLEWVTDKENKRHYHLSGNVNILRGEQHSKAILTEKQVICIKIRLRKGERVKDLALEFGVGAKAVSSIKTGKNWSHVKI